MTKDHANRAGRAHNFCKTATRFTIAIFFLVTNLAAYAGDESVWVDFETDGDIAYLLKASPPVMLRYNLSTQEWLTSISLTEAPDVFLVDGDDVFIAYPGVVRKRSIAGGSESLVAEFNGTAVDLLMDGNLLFINRSASLWARLTVVDTNDNSVLDEWDDYVFALMGSSIAPGANRIFGRSKGISPSDIAFADFHPNGTVIEGNDSPYHGDLPGASKTWVFPGEEAVVDSSGTIYAAADLTYVNALAINITDLVFAPPAQPIVLSEDILVRFSQRATETDRFALGQPAVNIALHGDRVFAFGEDELAPDGVHVEIIELSEFAPRDPDPAIDPVGLEYEPTMSTFDSNGVVYLANDELRSLFRWDLVNQSYLPSIGLFSEPRSIDYSAPLNRLYLLDSQRSIYRLELSGAPGAFELHANTALSANTLISMNRDLLAVVNGSWEDQWIFGEHGNMLVYQIDCCYVDFHLFDEPRQRLYYEGIWQEYLGGGTFGQQSSRGGSGTPIAISPDSSLMLSHNGVVHRADTMTAIDNVPNEILAGGWNSELSLFTVAGSYIPPWQPQATDTTIQKWNAYISVAQEVVVQGAFRAFHMIDDQVLLVTSIDGVPKFTLLDDDLNIVPPPTLESPQISVSSYTLLAARLRWDDVQGEAEYAIERRQTGDTQWVEIGSVAFDITSYIDSTVEPGSSYQYRAMSRNGVIASAYSNVVEVDLSYPEETGIDPESVAFVPDDVQISNDNVVLLLSGEHQSIFRWSADTLDWLETIPLISNADKFSYSAETNSLFTIYEGGAIFSASLDTEYPYEFPHDEVSAYYNCGITATARSVVTCYNPSYWRVFRAVDLAGDVINETQPNFETYQAQWNAANQSIYHFRWGIVPNNLVRTQILPNGAVGESLVSPAEPESGIGAPIRVHPDGSVVLIGTGRIYDGMSLEHLDDLGHEVDDAFWLQGNLVTLTGRTINSHSMPGYAPTPEVTLERDVLRVLPTNDDRFVVVMQTSNGKTELRVFDQAFRPLGPILLRTSFE